MAQNRFDVVCYLPQVGFDGSHLVRRMEIITDGFWAEAVKLARENTMEALKHAGFKGIHSSDLAVDRAEQFMADNPGVFE